MRHLVVAEVRLVLALELVEVVLVGVERRGGVIEGHQRSLVVGLVLVDVDVVVVGLLGMHATFSSAVAASASVVASLALVACSSVLALNLARRPFVSAGEIVLVVLHASRSRPS